MLKQPSGEDHQLGNQVWNFQNEKMSHWYRSDMHSGTISKKKNPLESQSVTLYL